MNREDILAKSRNENKNQDFFEKEVMRDGGSCASIAAALLAAILFIVQVLIGCGANYGLFAVVFSIPAVNFTVKYAKLRKKHELFAAICYILLVLLCSFAHVYSLILTPAHL